MDWYHWGILGGVAVVSGIGKLINVYLDAHPLVRDPGEQEKEALRLVPEARKRKTSPPPRYESDAEFAQRRKGYGIAASILAAICACFATAPLWRYTQARGWQDAGYILDRWTRNAWRLRGANLTPVDPVSSPGIIEAVWWLTLLGTGIAAIWCFRRFLKCRRYPAPSQSPPNTSS